MTILYQDLTELLCNIVVNIIMLYNIYTLSVRLRVMMSRVHLYCVMYMYGSDGPQAILPKPEHASAVVSMLNQMTDGRLIMQKPKMLL